MRGTMTDTQAERAPDGGLSPEMHVKILASLSILGGAFILLGGLFVSLGIGLGSIAGTAWLGPWGWILPGLVVALIGWIVFVAILIAGVSIAGGVGLLLGEEWGRVVTLIVAVGVGVFAVLTLTFVPLAYALYGLWVLTNAEVVEGFKRPVSEGDFPDEPRGLGRR